MSLNQRLSADHPQESNHQIITQKRINRKCLISLRKASRALSSKAMSISMYQRITIRQPPPLALSTPTDSTSHQRRMSRCSLNKRMTCISIGPRRRPLTKQPLQFQRSGQSRSSHQRKIIRKICQPPFNGVSVVPSASANRLAALPGRKG